jgi:hypothetical protein
MRLAGEHPASLVCGVLDCPRSSYYYQAREPDDQALKEVITQVAATWPTYGTKEEEVELSEYQDYWDAYKQIGQFLEEVDLEIKKRQVPVRFSISSAPSRHQRSSRYHADTVWCSGESLLLTTHHEMYLQVS